MRTIVPEYWTIPEQIRERFGETAGRQRAMYADGHLLLVLHAPPRQSDRVRIARLFWRDPEGNWVSNYNGTGAGVLRRHIAEYADRAAELELPQHTEHSADHYFEALNEVAPLHRAVRNLHSTLQQARELVDEDKDIIVARDAAADIERTLELLHQDAKNGLDYTIAQKTEQQSHRSYEMAVSAHRLNLLAAVFFPITAISSVFGMNISSGLESSSSSSLFWGILGAGFVTGILLMKLITKPTSIDPTSAELRNPKMSLDHKAQQKSRQSLRKNRISGAVN
jgi:hypothetical protein